jgi:multicomponent Na+:H+ antiporter subunit D
MERVDYLGNAPAATISTERRAIPRIMTSATVGMVAVTLALTVFAGPLLDMCLRAGVTITDGVSLVQVREQAGQQ